MLVGSVLLTVASDTVIPFGADRCGANRPRGRTFPRCRAFQAG